MPSWQARLFNFVTRTSLKPMMRFGSIATVRQFSAMAERQKVELPANIVCERISARIYEGEWIRDSRAKPPTVLLYFPGGAFIMRVAAQHRRFAANVCRAAKVQALIVHYRLAPENPFPMGLEDCLAAYHDLLDQGIEPANICLVGDSAGGGLVLSTLLALRDERSPMPRNATIVSALGDLTYTGESREFNKHRDPMLPTHRASQMHQLYIGEALPGDRYLSPVLADFNGLPPLFGIVGSTEILLDDTIRAARRAAAASVPFYLDVWHEMPHAFPAFGYLPESRLAIKRMAAFFHNSRVKSLAPRYGTSDPDAVDRSRGHPLLDSFAWWRRCPAAVAAARR